MQLRNSHAAVIAQVTSHAHELLQSMPRHEFDPWHCTSQSPPPQFTLRHEPEPEHVIAQDRAALQLIPLEQALFVEHRIAQFQPVGQTIGWLPLQFVMPQSIVQVFEPSVQLVHCAGHTFIGLSIIIGASRFGASICLGASIAPPGTMQ